jgi:hypothetical protein
MYSSSLNNFNYLEDFIEEEKEEDNNYFSKFKRMIIKGQKLFCPHIFFLY